MATGAAAGIAGAEAHEKTTDYQHNESACRKQAFETKTTPSKDLIDALEEGGAVVKETEKILNETDMRFQEMFARLKTFLNNR